MTVSTALTVIAVCFAIFAIIVIGLGIALFIVILRVIRLEKTVSHEISEIRQLLSNLIHTARDSSSRLGETAKEFKQSAYRVGLVATGLAGLIESRKHKGVKLTPAKLRKVRPWWLSSLALGYSLWRKRRRKKQPSSSSGVSS